MGSMHPHPIEREYEEKFIWGPPIYHPHARLGVALALSGICALRRTLLFSR